MIYHHRLERSWPPPIRKEDAACCVAYRDEHGRLPVGWCSDECERRAQHLARYAS